MPCIGQKTPPVDKGTAKHWKSENYFLHAKFENKPKANK